MLCTAEGLLGQFDQGAVSGSWMKKSDSAAAGSGAWQVVNHCVSGLAARGERRIEIRHAVADMVKAGASLGDKAADGRVRGGGFEQFDLRLTEVNVNDPGAVDILRAVARHAEDVGVE